MEPRERRAILEAVARGEISPSQAAERLGDVAAGDASNGVEAADHPETHRQVAEPGPSPARSVRIEANAAGVNIIGDPEVSEAVTDGPCELHRSGDVLVITIDPAERLQAFGFVMSSGRHRDRPRFRQRGIKPEKVTIRVNPALPVEVDANAASVKARGLRGGMRCSLNAGSLKLLDVDGPVQAQVNAGSVSWIGRIAAGESRISAEMGAVKVLLDETSDVSVGVAGTLAKVKIDGADRAAADRFHVGNGSATLDIEANMGAVTVGVAAHAA